MHHLAPPLFAFFGSLVMAAYVLARRHKEAFHWVLAGFLVGLVLWTGGVLARLASSDELQLLVSVKIIFVGILISASFWLLTAVAYSEQLRSGVGTFGTVIVFSVAALFAMALFTNDGHRLFLRRVDFESITQGPRAFVGPLFWVFLSWAYACVGFGIVLYLRAARGMVLADSKRRGWMLAISSVFPVAASTIYVFRLAPVSYDLTPMGLVASILVLWRVVFRYRLFESLPLAREAVLAHLDDGVVMASASGRVIHWNRAAEEIFARTGILPREPLADALARLFPALDPNTAKGVALARSATRPRALRTPDGRVIELTLAKVDADHGAAAAGEFAILSDRSETARAEQLARQTQRLEIVGVLAAEVAEEVNEPLAAVRASLVEIERLAVGVGGGHVGADAKLAEDLGDIRDVALETLEGVERIRRIVEGMRELSTVEQGGFGEVDLAGVARDAMRLARLDLRDDGPRVEASLGASPPVFGNADRLLQVVLNLLVNARQALAGVAEPRIYVETRVDGGLVELSVRDNGCGIPEALRHRVFDPFFTTRGPDEGTGLGLAIAFDIAREHGGVLEERSGSEGGACFALRIPVAAGRAGATPAR